MATIFGQTVKPFGSPAYQYIRTTDKLPSTDEVHALPWADAICKVKLFHPYSSFGPWYIAGFDPDTGLAIGVVNGFDGPGYGDVDMNELRAVRLMGLPVERDLWWEPQSIESLMRGKA
jgi:hypothetical protein